MNELIGIVEKLSGLCWLIVTAGAIFTAIFLVVFIWFTTKIFKQFYRFNKHL